MTVSLLLTGSLSAQVDLDENGLSDVWERYYGALDLDLDPEGDADGDGLSNRDEARAGTDPFSIISSFAVFEVSYEEDATVISWDSQPGKFYRIRFQDGLTGDWSDATGILEGVDGVVTLRLPATGVGDRFYQIAVFDVDTDEDGLLDWEEIKTGLNPRNGRTFQGQDDASFLNTTLAATEDNVTLQILDGRASEAGIDKASFRLRRTGGLDAITVALEFAGNATIDTDYTVPMTTVEMPFGVREVTLFLTPLADELDEGEEDIQVTILPGDGYRIGTPGPARLSLLDPVEVLYLADLRSSGPAHALGFGYGAFKLNEARDGGVLDFSFSNLTTWQESSTLRLGPESDAPVVATLPMGQLEGESVSFLPGPHGTVEEVITALQTGGLYLHAGSDNYPASEIRGHFRLAASDRPMPPPNAPGTLPAGPLTEAQAVRFLTQSTFGPTEEAITEVMTRGIEGWIDWQMTVPASHKVPFIEDRYAKDLSVNRNHRQEIWWENVVTGPDELRQRMAFALSQIFVISDNSGVLGNEILGVSAYYDMLVDNAFGNFRDLLEDVSLSPAMGRYLSHLKNEKPDPVRGVFPDENFAREVMQLFSIGLVQLYEDGTLKRDHNGQPINTYGQEEISGIAHVFTGWSYHNPEGPVNWRWGPRIYTEPMMAYPDYHDTGPKRILDGVILPAGQTAEEDLAALLDQLHNHPNTPAFISKLLIQRFVTSNPSPGYVYRVAEAFRDNGEGVRGDLGAVLKAIFLDYEARSPEVTTNLTFGKQREPLVRAVHMFRTFKAASETGEWRYWNPENDHSQACLRAPSVFNFFEPAYSQPGMINANGLLSPEFQITTETTVVLHANWMERYFWRGSGWGETALVPDLSVEEALTDTPEALLDHIDRLLHYGQMPAEMRSDILTAMQGVVYNNDAARTRIERTRSALMLAATSPDFVIQK